MPTRLSVIQGGAQNNFYADIYGMKAVDILDRLDVIMDGCDKNFYVSDGCLCLEYTDPVAINQLHNAKTLLDLAGVRHHIYPWGVTVELYGSRLEFVGR